MTEAEQTDKAPKRMLTIDAADSLDTVERVTKGLGSDQRLLILNLLGNRVFSVNEIARALDMPSSTATLHINVLEEAGLIQTELTPATRGLQKVCSRRYDRVIVDLRTDDELTRPAVEVSMPLGSYTDSQVSSPCGLAGELGIIGILDDPASFYEPDHIYAELIWFKQGYVEYRFPNRLPPRVVADSVHLSMEISSSAPLHDEDWPSDITIWVNGLEIGTWTSPGDFGGQRGSLTPGWWEDGKSQYGMLKVWKVTRDGSFVDGMKVSDHTFDDLGFDERPFVSVRIGIKDDAHNIGGINIFGSRFGNYPQNILLTTNYTWPEP